MEIYQGCVQQAGNGGDVGEGASCEGRVLTG